MSALSVGAAQLPAGVAGKLPKHPIPAALLGRLGVERSVGGGGVGTMLAVNALHRARAFATDIALFATVVAVKDEAARRFYQRLGFVPFPETPLRLFLPLASVRE